MPFGLFNTVATQKRLADRIRSGLARLGLLVYVDDFALISESLGAHLSELRQVFQKYVKIGLRLNQDKCKFFCLNLKFLGHIISSERISPDRDKAKPVAELEVPRSTKQLISFKATCSWFCRFISNFASVAEPLTSLTKKAAAWT